MQTTRSLGDIVRLTLNLVADGVGATAQTPTMAIQRHADGRWFRVSDDTWQVTIVNNPMVQTNASDLPGRYHLDFDHSMDDLGSRLFLVKKVNAGSPAALEYEDLEFGPVAGAVAPDMCAVTGTIYTAAGRAARTEHVRATLVPVFMDELGRGIQSDRVVLVATNENGDFSISLVQGATYRLEIPSIGFDQKVTIPEEATTLFTDL